MTVAPLIAMKSTKCESLEAVGKELDRRAHTYANDVDQGGRHVGYLCRAGDESPVPLEQAIERRMGELNTKRRDGLRRTLRSWKPSLPSLTSSTTRAALRSAESSIQSLLDAMDSEDELSGPLRESEERLDGLRWQLRTSPESSGR